MSMPEFNDGDKVRVMNNNVTEELGCGGVVGRVVGVCWRVGVKCCNVEDSANRVYAVPHAHLIKVD